MKISYGESDRIDTMKRRRPQNYVIGEPAVFSPVVAGPEFEAECQELQKFKLSEDEPFMYQVLRLRKRRREIDERDQELYGDGYQERLRIRDAIGSDVFEWIKPMAENARARGFSFFRCNTDRSRLQLQFADGKGAYFQRSVSLKRFADKYGISLDWNECPDISSATESCVLGLNGMRSLDHGMTSKRVPANIPTS